MKEFLTLFFTIFQFSCFAQSGKENITFNYREVWSSEYNIKLDFKISSTDSVVVHKIVNHKKESFFKIAYVDYEILRTEALSAIKNHKKDKLFCVDGNSLSIAFDDKAKTFCTFSCISEEGNTQAVKVLRLLKNIIRKG